MAAGQRAQWGSRLGFILAAAGSAVGLGNIWRFPYMTGRNQPESSSEPASSWTTISLHFPPEFTMI